jgi:hypothetical protein
MRLDDNEQLNYNGYVRKVSTAEQQRKLDIEKYQTSIKYSDRYYGKP